MDAAAKAARMLARRSSRRQFFKFLGAGSLGAGLWLTRTGVSLGSVSGCVGCGGGPCNPCFSPATLCDNLGDQYTCKTCQQGGGCPAGCATVGRVVLLPERDRVPPALLGVQLPAGLPERLLPLLHDAEHPVRPARQLRRAAVPVPAAGAATRPGDQRPRVAMIPLFVLVSLSLVVGLSTAASP